MQYVPPYGATDPNASYVEGNPATGTRGSYPTATGYEAMMREVCNAITLSGFTQNPNDLTQLYQAISLNRRTQLQANLQLYVGGAGASDSNSGTSTAPFATLQAACNYIAQKINTNGFNVTVNCTGAFNAGVANYVPFVGGGVVTFVLTSGSSVSVANGSCFLASGPLSGFNVTTSAGALATLSASGSGVNQGCGVLAVNYAIITINNLSFGACGSAHIDAISGGYVAISGPIAIAASAPSCLNTSFRGQIAFVGSIDPTFTVTLTGTPAFSTAFAVCIQDSIIACWSSIVTFSGAATGVRFSVTDTSLINTAGGGASFLPGNTSGSASNSFNYN